MATTKRPATQRLLLLAVAFGCGLAVMNSEIAVGRLLAPYYGTSTTIWALLIATVLGSLALGNLLGGKLSRLGEPRRWLTLGLVGAAAVIALMPWLGRLLLAGSLQRLREGNLLALGASLLGMSLLLTLPLLQLGTIGPLLVQACGATHEERGLGAQLGAMAGGINAASTVGSLAGTLGAGLLFIPWLGTTVTLWIGSAVLAVSALLVGTWRAWCTVAPPTLVVLVWVASTRAEGAAPTAAVGRLLWQRESRYQHLFVTQTGAERQLRVNDGFAVQSYVPLDGNLPLRGVWGFYALAPAFGTVPSPRRVLLLGMGGGTSAQLYRRLYPEARVTGVELDGQMVEAGRRWLGFEPDGVEVVVDDARSFVAERREERRAAYDVILVDAFHFPYIPFQLTTLEFFRDLDKLLAPGGVLMLNVGRFDAHRDVVDAIACTLHGALLHVLAADAPGRSNTLLVATRHPPSQGVGVSALGVDLTAHPQLLRHLSLFREARWSPATPVLTDDHAAVEWLTDRVLFRALLKAAQGGDGL